MLEKICMKIIVVGSVDHTEREAYQYVVFALLLSVWWITNDFIQVRLFPGGKLDYESKCYEKHKCEREIEHHPVTAVELSADDPYGGAVALLDMKSGTVKVTFSWKIYLFNQSISLLVHIILVLCISGQRRMVPFTVPYTRLDTWEGRIS